MWKNGSNSSTSIIVAETSFALQVLLDRVKFVWVGAQGDRWVKGVDKAWTPFNGSVSTNASVVGTLVGGEGGYVVESD